MARRLLRTEIIFELDAAGLLPPETRRSQDSVAVTSMSSR